MAKQEMGPREPEKEVPQQEEAEPSTSRFSEKDLDVLKALEKTKAEAEERKARGFLATNNFDLNDRGETPSEAREREDREGRVAFEQDQKIYEEHLKSGQIGSYQKEQRSIYVEKIKKDHPDWFPREPKPKKGWLSRLLGGK